MAVNRDSFLQLPENPLHLHTMQWSMLMVLLLRCHGIGEITELLQILLRSTGSGYVPHPTP